MSSPGYVWEKMYLVVSRMCGDGDFVERLEDASVPSPIVLDVTDLSGELADDLAYILGWTKDNMVEGKLQSIPSELDRRELVEKMLHVMLATYRQ